MDDDGVDALLNYEIAAGVFFIDSDWTFRPFSDLGRSSSQVYKIAHAIQYDSKTFQENQVHVSRLFLPACSVYVFTCAFNDIQIECHRCTV